MTTSTTIACTSEAILADLIRLLHQGAAADEFFAQMTRAEQIEGLRDDRAMLVECIRMAMAIRNRLDMQQQREHGLLAVVESAQYLSSQLDLLGLLRAIVARARALLGAHVAWISVYNPDLERMQVQVTDGAIFEETDKMTTRKHFGVGGVVFATKMPFTTPDYLSDDRFLHDPVLDEIFRNEGVSALVGVPLLSGNEVVGLLFVADRYHRSHSALEVSILSTLATHAAVAMKTAQAFDMTNKALANGDLARAELERHARNVQMAAEAHEKLTSLLAKGASLKTLCQTVATLLDGRVLIVDEGLQPICHGIPEESPPGSESMDVPEHHGGAIEQAIRQSRACGRSVLAYATEEERCRVVSVIGGESAVGAILLFRRGDLDELSVRTFERSASVIGIVLLSQDRAEIRRSRDVAALVRGLLQPSQYDHAETLERADQFNLDLGQSLSLVLLDTGELKASYVAKRLRAMPSLVGSVLDEIDGVVAIICRTAGVQDVVDACSRLLLKEFKANCCGVVSKPSSGAESLAEHYSTLRRALVVARRLAVRGIVQQSELALYSVLFETQDGSSLEAFLESSIGCLLAHDQKRGSALAATLLCYFDCNRNSRLVAKRLNIHVNTVRQRLALIEEMLGHLGNPTRMLEIHVALRLWGMSRKNEDPNP